MGGWYDAYSFRCQPVEHENYGRPMRVSFNRKYSEKYVDIFGFFFIKGRTLEIQTGFKFS